MSLSYKPYCKCILQPHLLNGVVVGLVDQLGVALADDLVRGGGHLLPVRALALVPLPPLLDARPPVAEQVRVRLQMVKSASAWRPAPRLGRVYSL